MRRIAAVVSVVGLLAFVPVRGGADAQSSSTHGQPVVAGPVRWESSSAPASRLAQSIAGRESNMTADAPPGVTGALLEVGEGRRLLLTQGGPWQGASTSGIGIYADRGDSVLRNAGIISGSRLDSVSIIVMPGNGGGFPALRVTTVNVVRYNPNLPMVSQRYAPTTSILRFDPQTSTYSTARR